MTKYLDKSFTVPVNGGANYEKVFGHSGPKKRQVVDTHKNPYKLSSYQKNALYKKAKEMKEHLRDALCTKNECNDPNDHNIKKMIHSEFKNKKKLQEYRTCMQAINADPKDCSTERLRRR